MPRRRNRRLPSDLDFPRASRRVNRCRALLVIDNAPLQAAAWAELARARRHLNKATRDVHRHEETDEPGFRGWLARQFPLLVSATRELLQRFEARSGLVAAVEQEAFFTGRSAAKIWREWQRHGGRPPPPSDADPTADPAGRAGAGEAFDDEPFPGAADIFEEEVQRLFEREGIAEDDPRAGAFREMARSVLGVGPPAEDGPGAASAREIHRRLVRELHPDRGGEWTAARARQWEQVQAAWEARDADWLARLEVEWEAATDRLGPGSPLGRLRAALHEIDAARRDAEKRVRAYRKADAWRFSLQPPTAEFRVRIEARLRAEKEELEFQLEEVETIVATWERTSQRKSTRRRHTTGQVDFGF